jgi:hypothetical protein
MLTAILSRPTAGIRGHTLIVSFLRRYMGFWLERALAAGEAARWRSRR